MDSCVCKNPRNCLDLVARCSLVDHGSSVHVRILSNRVDPIRQKSAFLSEHPDKRLISARIEVGSDDDRSRAIRWHAGFGQQGWRPSPNCGSGSRRFESGIHLPIPQSAHLSGPTRLVCRRRLGKRCGGVSLQGKNSCIGTFSERQLDASNSGHLTTAGPDESLPGP